MSPDLTNDILQALIRATDEQKHTALQVLLGNPTPKPAATGPLLLGMTKAAKLLGVSRATLWRMVRSKKIHKIELFPGSYRIRKSDIEEIVAEQKGGAS